MDHAKYIDLIAKYLSGNISDPERNELLEWAGYDPENQQFFDEMVQLWSIAGDYDEESFEADVPTAWEKLDQRIGGKSAPSASGGSARLIPLSVRSVLLRAAAAVVLLVAAAYGIYSAWTSLDGASAPQYIVVSTENQESKEVILPDGSQVWLNENSQLIYEAGFGERKVELAGEAFFDVAHQDGNKFVIIAGDAQTTVLGTAFNVRAYPDEPQVEVTVQRGKVALGKKTPASDQSLEPLILEAGTTGIFDLPLDRISKTEAATINADAWKTGVLNLDGLRMREVVTALQRYYDVTIDVSNEAILNCTVTGLVYERESLDTVLKGLSFIMNLEIGQPSDSLIVLKGRGCTK